MPLYLSSPEDRHQNPVRYRNVLRTVRETLQKRRLSEEHIESIIGRVDDLDWSEVTKDRVHGLCVYVSRGSYRIFGLPYEVPEYAFVHNRFYVRPLLPFLTHNGSFYVATLSRHALHFFSATPYHIEPIELEGIPEDLSLAAENDGRAGHTGERVVTHQGKFTVVHQKGSVLDDIRMDVDAYMHVFANQIMKHIENENDPLVLIGEEHLVSEFKKMLHYQRLIEPPVYINPESLSMDDVHEKALHQVKLCLNEERNSAVKEYYNRSNTNLVSSDLEEIVKAADARRIKTLFLNLQEQRWGTFNPEKQEVSHLTQVNGQVGVGDVDDLLDFAAARTLSGGGDVYASLDEDPPNGAIIAAIYRY